MKKLLILVAFAGISIFMVNCSSSKSSSTTVSGGEMTPEAKVAEVKKKYTAPQLEEGKNLMTTHCQKCHGLKLPETRTVQKLEAVLPSMINKSKVTQEQGELIRAYMIAHAKLS